MTAVNLNSKAPPIFLSRNYFTRYSDQQNDLSVSSGVALRHRLYDMDKASIWSGENADDSVDESIAFGLWLPGFQSAQSVDFLAVLGHNLKAFDWDFSANNGASYPGASQQVYTGLAATYKITNLSSAISANKLKLTAHTTQTVSQYKQIGAIIAASVQLQPTFGMSAFKRLPQRVKDRTAEMHDRSLRRNYVYRSDASIGFNDFTVGLSALTETEADSLMNILQTADPFIFVPEPGDRPYNMYLGCAAPGTVTRDYLSLSRGGGEVISFDFQEIGGA